MPYKGEHSCRLNDPAQYDEFRRGNCDQKYEGKCIDIIYGIKTKPERKSDIQALRYSVKIWTESEARNHCKSRDGSFEPAEEGGEEALGNPLIKRAKTAFDKFNKLHHNIGRG